RDRVPHAARAAARRIARHGDRVVALAGDELGALSRAVRGRAVDVRLRGRRRDRRDGGLGALGPRPARPHGSRVRAEERRLSENVARKEAPGMKLKFRTLFWAVAAIAVAAML